MCKRRWNVLTCTRGICLCARPCCPSATNDFSGEEASAAASACGLKAGASDTAVDNAGEADSVSLMQRLERGGGGGEGREKHKLKGGDSSSSRNSSKSSNSSGGSSQAAT